MLSSARRLYGLMAVFCIVGYTWLYLHIDKSWSTLVGPVCILKKITGLPCPSCGSTRSMLSLIHGDIASAWFWNPFGFLILGGLMVAPLWLMHDVIRNQRTLMSAYRSFEMLLQRKFVAWPLVIIVLLNWCWNIYKGI
jgi:hypothetical protein